MNTTQLHEQIADLVARDMSPQWRAARILELINDTPDNAGEIVPPLMNTYSVEMIIGDVYRVTVSAPDVASAVDIATGIDVRDDMSQHLYDVAIIDSDRHVQHVAVTGGAGR